MKLSTLVRFASAAGILAMLAGAAAVVPASAQVTYRPFRPASPYGYANPYGYPVPYGYLQPDEVLGTSPSFEIDTGAYGLRPVARVVRRCQYPDGWSATDFTRDVNGTPAGLDHTCPAGGPGAGRLAY